MQEIYDRFGKISMGGSAVTIEIIIMITKCVGKGSSWVQSPFPIGSSTSQLYRLTLVHDLRL